MPKIDQPVVDVFLGDAVAKLYKLAGLKNADHALELAVDAIAFYQYGNRDDDNAFRSGNLYRMYHVNTYADEDKLDYEVGAWLFEREFETAYTMRNETLRECYYAVVQPLQEFIQKILNSFNEKQKCEN